MRDRLAKRFAVALLLVAVAQRAFAQAPANQPLAFGTSVKLVAVPVFVTDKSGRAVSGLAAVDNGNPASVESFQAPQRKAFSGMALVVVRSRRGEPGAIQVQAESQGLAPARAVIQATR